MKYAHGEYVVSRCGAIMAVQAQGPWNRECVVKFAEDYRSEREGLAGNRWGDIVFVTGESLFVPDAADVLKSLVKSVMKLGLSHIAVVLGNSTVRSSTKTQLEKIYNSLGIAHVFVETNDQALQWLESEGYLVDKTALATHYLKSPTNPN